MQPSKGEGGERAKKTNKYNGVDNVTHCFSARTETTSFGHPLSAAGKVKIHFSKRREANQPSK